MLSNIIDVDFEVSLKHDQGAIVLFDFRAAFPSAARDFLFAVLEWIGVPSAGHRFIRSLYSQNRCIISCKGAQCDGFRLTAGIHQGARYLMFAV